MSHSAVRPHQTRLNVPEYRSFVKIKKIVDKKKMAKNIKKQKHSCCSSSKYLKAFKKRPTMITNPPAKPRGYVKSPIAVYADGLVLYVLGLYQLMIP